MSQHDTDTVASNAHRPGRFNGSATGAGQSAADPQTIGKTLVDLFVEGATQTPDRVAVTLDTESMTFRELDEKSNQLARYLQKQGVGEEMLVPICINRSPGMIIGLLGILKAGGAFVPVDPDYPADRIRYMLADVGSPVILTSAQTRRVVPELAADRALVCFDRDWPTVAEESPEPLPTRPLPHHLAYVIYTSGSTGRPKGVLIEHRSIAAYVLNSIQAYTPADEPSASGSYLHLPLAFDASLTTIFVPLLTGQQIVINGLSPIEAFTNGTLTQHGPFDFLKVTPAQLYLIDTAADPAVKTVTNRYVVGGEALHRRHYQFLTTAGVDAEIINEYGPTEATVGCISFRFHVRDAVAEYPNGLPIGRPMPNVSIYLLDAELNPVPVGVAGEIYIGGVQVARGYLNQPELTNERFLADPFAPLPGARMYRTGDLARQLPDGSLEYLGRIDEQVKIRGYRIEPGEIESVLQQYPGVTHCAVAAKADADGQQRLVGYVVMNGGFDRRAIITFLLTKLPDYMVPQLLVSLPAISLTGNGKVDKKSLLNPDASELLTETYVAPTTSTETNISAVWKTVLNVKQVGSGDNFFELGGSSLLAARAVAVLKQEYGYDLPITKLYQYPTVGGIAAFLDGRTSERSQPVNPRRTRPDTADIAVIGMAGRFPGADTIEELWTVLKEGRETISFFADDELDPQLRADLVNDPAYVKARGIIQNIDQFDAEFFGLNPRLAAVMDPQQRIFMEIAWETLEKTGHLPQTYDGVIGVYAGCGNNTYYLNNVLCNREVVDQIGEFQVSAANEKDYIASRTAYQLNLKGPAVSVFSACSTSLLAIAQAVDSLRNGQCDVALAGGASVTAPVNSGHLYQEGAIYSRDGHCRSFDAGAQGTVFSDGAGVVLLKPLADAQRDGDTIFAVIKGTGVNNDGGGKGSFTAPNAEGQAGAIRMALENARVNPSTISYVEAHGTATPLGDPIEIEGLKMAFGDGYEKQSCAIGSIKSNMGHLTAAAGVAGFIKTTLALHYRQLPPSLGFETPNPVIDFANSPFFVNTTLRDWSANDAQAGPRRANPRRASPRRAGVSSFGVGGTNVHVILEEYVAGQPAPEPTPAVNARPMQLITWSAKSAASLDAYADRLAGYLTRHPTVNLADVAATLQTTRPAFAHRRFALAATPGDLLPALQTPAASASIGVTTDRPAGVAFLFPGQGSQYLNMGRDLYTHEPVYRNAVDACADLLREYVGVDIRDVMYADTVGGAAKERLKNTRYAQPALFATEYALARLWMSWGIEPTVFCGHSIGEFVGAHLAGVFTLADALRLIAERGRLVSERPRGSMLSVRLPAVGVLALLPDTLSLAAVNSPGLCVVAGADEAIAAFARVLDERDLPNRVLETSHAFHSAMMDPIVADFETLVRQVVLNRPRKPIVSTVSGTWLTDAQATDPNYWATHLRLTVRFADALETLFTQPNTLLLEVGPGAVTSTLARQQAAGRPVRVLTSMDGGKDGLGEYPSVLKAVGGVWLAGLEPDWTAFCGSQKRHKLVLPTYAFSKKRCWVEPVDGIIRSPAVAEERPQSTDTTPTIHSRIIPMRKSLLLDKIRVILEEASGIDMDGVTPDMTFLEIGLDSLLLTQVAITIKKAFSVPLTFRQLNEQYATLEQLARYLDQTLPAEPVPPPQAAPVAVPTAVPSYNNEQPAYTNGQLVYHNPPTSPALPAGDSALGLIAQQLQILAKQVALLQGGTPSVSMPAPVSAPPVPTAAPVPSQLTPSVSADLTPEEAVEIKKPFGATARIDRHTIALTPAQQTFIQQLTERYNKKTGASKAYAQQHRAQMADPRVVSGFKPLTKEVVYPIVVNRSKGSRLWDIDGNEYIDVLNGFGSNLLGYQPDELKNALHDQIERGFEVGPQHELAGEVSQLICEFTGFDRAALCSTGSEAVMGTMRIARTVTGRSLIVAFTGSYHGIMDEVLVRGTKKLKSFPAASGILPESVQNMLILDYGTDESLRIIRERAHELAAVLVEPVQSRRPEFQPVDFLKAVRAITAESGTALIFDEVITGFRMHSGGAQALFGIEADIASYGKVVGGGLPIGIIAGRAEYMDALDGGFWQYGDASFPEVGVTYFAGTFVRHPLALAAAKASLQYIKAKGPALQKGLTAKAERLANTLNGAFTRRGLPFFVAQFGSLWKIKFTEDIPYSELLFTLMREKGIHVWDGFPCFMTEAHTTNEITRVGDLFIESVNEMVAAGFFTEKTPVPATRPGASVSVTLNQPPVPGARLGRDKTGNPAWFIADPAQPGTYLQFDLA